ncbi:MAG: RodZ domain-containing protein [Gallionella sp.]
MEYLSENNPAQDLPPTSLGRILREARDRLNFSVADVAAQIKFAPRQIEALEAEDFKQLPEAAFLRGFVRSYAKILNLDAETLLAALPQTKVVAAEMIPPSVDVPFPVGQPSQKQNLILLVAALLLAMMVLGFAVWHFTTPLKPSFEVARVETPVPLPAEMPFPLIAEQTPVAPAIAAKSKLRSAITAALPPASSIPSTRTAKSAAVQAVPKARSTNLIIEQDNSQDTAAETTTLRLVFVEESWTEITGKDGKMISSQVHLPGSEMNLKARLPLSLVIGHAAATRLYEDGEQVDLKPYTNSSSEVARLTIE